MDAASVVDQMLAAGLPEPPQPLDLSGRVRRFGKRKHAWYRLREQRLDSGRYIVVGSFGDWRQGVRERVTVDWSGITAEEREHLAQRRRAQADADAAARQRQAAMASMQAGTLWGVATREGRSEYLVRKLVDAEACRYLPDGSIIIPLVRLDQPRESALKGLQRIWPDGRKRFTRGFDKPGAALRLGLVVAGEPILLCEGYATGLSLRMAVGRRLPVVVALDAGNLMPVAKVLRAMYPRERILICADDDWRTRGPDGSPWNTGRVKARAAAKEVPGVDVVCPVFPPGRRGEKDTDFNDLHALVGLHAVARQIRSTLQVLAPEILLNVAA